MYVVFIGGTNDGAGLIVDDDTRHLEMPKLGKKTVADGEFHRRLETEHYHVVRLAGESEIHCLAICGVTVDQAIKKLMVRYTKAADEATESRGENG